MEKEAQDASESNLPMLEHGLEAFRDQDWTHAKWNGKIVVVPLEDDTYSIYVNGNDGSYRPLLSELTYEHAHDLVDLLNTQDEIKEARAALQEPQPDLRNVMELPNDPNFPPDDPQKIREAANYQELAVVQRSGRNFTLRDSDVVIGERFLDLLEITSQRQDRSGQEAKKALEHFTNLYTYFNRGDQWKAIGYDIRTGTSSARPYNSPNEGTATIAAVMLATLSDGDRLNSLLPDDAPQVSGGVPAHVKGVNLNKVITMEKEAQDAIKYIGERLPKPDWETARNLVSSADRKGFVYLAKPNAQYAGKVLMMSETHLVQQVGKNSAVAHDLSVLENGPELERQFDNGEIKAGRTHIKVEYGQDRGKVDIVTYNQQRAETVQTQAEKWAEQNITNSKSRETFLKHVRTFAQDMAKGQEPAKTLPDKAKAPETTQTPQQQQRGR